MIRPGGTSLQDLYLTYTPGTQAHMIYSQTHTQDHYLHSFFATAIGLGQQALACGGVLQGTDGGISRAAILLLAQCMQWEFHRPDLPCSVLAKVGLWWWAALWTLLVQESSSTLKPTS